MDRDQRGAFARGMRKAGNDAPAIPVWFRDQLDILAVLGGFANHVSVAQTGLSTTTGGMLASIVFAKCCAHARSIGAISVQSSMFDHHAIMSLARMIMEASTMIAYLIDPVSPDEWAFRYTLLKLHDTVTRIKLLRGFDYPTEDLRVGREQLRAELAVSSAFEHLPVDRQKRLASGEEMFAIGMRSVATKIMGWDEAQFSGVYAYFSAHAHSAPMSFMRMADHKIDYFFPSEAQVGVLALPIQVAIACLRRSMLRMIDQHPEQISNFHPELLAEARDLDNACPFFLRVQAR